MQTGSRERLQGALKRRERKRTRTELGTRLRAAGVSHSFLSDNAQDELLCMLRSPGAVLHERVVDVQYQIVGEALQALVDIATACFPEAGVFVPYRADERPAFLSHTRTALSALLADPFLLSVDGFLLLSPDGSSGAMISFDGEHLSSPAELSLLGYAAQEPS